jgi:dUTPase
MVLLYNLSDTDFSGPPSPFLSLMTAHACRIVNPGDRIAQLILERIIMAPLVEVEVSLSRP